MVVFRMLVVFGLALGALTVPGAAQRSKYTSPPAAVSATIGGSKIAVEYYAPSMHGRKIMGALAPYGEVWLTGANWATKITTDANLDIGGLKVPEGSYSIGTVPNEKEWTLIINGHRTVSPELRFLARLRPHQDERQDARGAGRDLQDPVIARGRK